MRLVILLDYPAAFVPLDHAPGVVEGSHRLVGQEQPGQAFFAFGRRAHLLDISHIDRQRLAAVVPVLGVRRQQANRPAAERELRVLAPFASLLRLHVHRETAQFGPCFGVVQQILFLCCAAVPRIDLARLAVANHEPPPAVEFMLQKLERAGPLIGHVDELRVGRQVRGSGHPQQTFTRRTVAMLGQRLVVGHFVAAMQNLSQEAQHFARVGRDRQHVLADVTAMIALADLSQVARQRREGRVVEFGRVVHHQHRTGVTCDPPQRVRAQGRHERCVRDRLTVAQAIEGLEIGRRRQLVGQRAAGMPPQAVERLDQPLRAPLVAELRVREQGLTQTGFVNVVLWHGWLPAKSARRMSCSLLRRSLHRGPTSPTLVKTTNHNAAPQQPTTPRDNAAIAADRRSQFCKIHQHRSG